MALFFQNRASEIFGVDIHPAAEIKGGVMIDHATGVVIGETTTIDENVSIYQGAVSNTHLRAHETREDIV